MLITLELSIHSFAWFLWHNTVVWHQRGWWVILSRRCDSSVVVPLYIFRSCLHISHRFISPCLRKTKSSGSFVQRKIRALHPRSVFQTGGGMEPKRYLYMLFDWFSSSGLISLTGRAADKLSLTNKNTWGENISNSSTPFCFQHTDLYG